MLVNIHDVFPQQYHREIEKYKNLIISLYDEYDVIVFMARKAICFYKSMIINGFLRPPKKNAEAFVVSSRVLKYNIYNCLKDKKVAIVDDVVIKGNSLIDVLGIMNENGVTADIYIAECTDSFIADNDSRLKEHLKGTYVVLTENNTLSLSQYITQYIEASMCPYNIDQPIYQMDFRSSGEALGYLSKSNTAIITSSRQEQFNIQNHIMHFSVESCKSTFGGFFDTKFISIAKIRFLYKSGSNSLIAIPIVLMNEMNYDDLDNAYKNISTTELDEFVEAPNKLQTYENKHKVLHYFLANCLMMAFVSSLSDNLDFCSIMRLDSNDAYSFSRDILEMVSKSDFDIVRLRREESVNDSFKLNDHLSSVYSYVFSNAVDEPIYYDDKGIRVKPEIITVANLREYVKKEVGDFDNFLLSNIFDILIDNGILVPSIVHSEDGKIVRMYKSGEIFKLTVEHFKLFAFMLGEYSTYIARPLYRTEFEKLCVLFFKKMGRYFEPTVRRTPYSFDEYSICYSQFGPRVSSNDDTLEVDEKKTLAEKLKSSKDINIVNYDDNGIFRSMYQVKHYGYNTPTIVEWKRESIQFAVSYSNLYNAYTALQKKLKNKYIYSYIDFLTLIAIGYNRRNQLQSLLAELHLFTKKIKDCDDSKNIIKVLQKVNDIVDGLESGMWKYMCYTKEQHPLEDMAFKMFEKDRSTITYFDIESDGDKSPWITEQIKKSGLLIYRITYTMYFLCHKYGVQCKMDFDNQKQRAYYTFRCRAMLDLRNDVEKQLYDSVESDDLGLLKALQNQAQDCKNNFEKKDKLMLNEKSEANAANTTIITAGDGAKITFADRGSIVRDSQNDKVHINEIAKLIDSVKKEAINLSQEDVEVVNESLEVIDNETKQKKPKKSFLNTAVKGLKAIKGSAEFMVAVAALAKFIKKCFYR